MKIYKVGEILSDLENCIENDLPFSHIRFGDGGIKYMSSVLRGDLEGLKGIIKKEGMPYERIVEVLELWGYYARRANYIDTLQVYLDGNFWPRVKSETKKISKQTSRKLLIWKDLYNRCEIDNENYCNPESNYLMTIRFNKNTRNILDVMKDRKVCVITARPGIKDVLYTFGYDVDIIEIVKQYENHYINSFQNVVEIIKNTSTDYDFWLVAAGELGRIYSGIIKECGGRAIDIGFVIEFWMGWELHPRLQPFLMRNSDNFLETLLHGKGKLFKEYI